MKIAVVGAGWSGAVIARELAEAGHRVEVFEERDHVAGNCHTERDLRTGIMVHVYGPHIFHTGNERVWDYVGHFGTPMMPYEHRVMATALDRVYAMPINLHTINQFFKMSLSPSEAQTHINRLVNHLDFERKGAKVESFADQVRSTVGNELYWAFFRGYTLKQWGRSPSDIPASVGKRLPVRFNYDTRYFDHKYQAMPREGYTEIVSDILDHHLITVHLNTRYTRTLPGFHHTFYSGPLDAFYNHCFGRLSYRTLDFIVTRHTGDVQGCPVMNYCDEDVKHTRITEFKHFTPWESHEQSICYKEFSREAMPADPPYYPIRLVDDKSMLASYEARAKAERDVTFVGRLGTYRYLDMDVCIAEALATADRFLDRTP